MTVSFKIKKLTLHIVLAHFSSKTRSRTQKWIEKKKGFFPVGYDDVPEYIARSYLWWVYDENLENLGSVFNYLDV